MTSTFWKVLIPDAEGKARKYDDLHVPYDSDHFPYDGTGYTAFWEEKSGD